MHSLHSRYGGWPLVCVGNSYILPVTYNIHRQINGMESGEHGHMDETAKNRARSWHFQAIESSQLQHRRRHMCYNTIMNKSEYSEDLAFSFLRFSLRSHLAAMGWNAHHDLWKPSPSPKTKDRINPVNFDIDMKALAVAQQLMLANVTQHRQSHVASTAALFNLVMVSTAKSTVKEDAPIAPGSHCFGATAQMVQDSQQQCGLPLQLKTVDGTATQTKHEPSLEMLVGHWEACDGKCIRVSRSDVGPLAQFHQGGSLLMIKEVDGEFVLNGWKITTRSSDKVLWKQVQGDFESLDNGTLKYKDELRELTWIRSESTT
jgi:hypothetical protein